MNYTYIVKFDGYPDRYKMAARHATQLRRRTRVLTSRRAVWAEC